MAITKTTDLTNAVKAVYEKKYYMMGLKNPGVWGQFINWESPVAESGGGGSSLGGGAFGPQAESIAMPASITPVQIGRPCWSANLIEYHIEFFSFSSFFQYGFHEVVPVISIKPGCSYNSCFAGIQQYFYFAFVFA